MLGARLWAAVAAIGLIGTGLLAGAVFAQDPSNFSVTDLNDNGEIDREEYHRRMMDTQYLADDDKDGMLSMDELPQADPGMFRAADGDRDGMLSTSEFMNSRFADFDAADQDGSGTLSPAEVDAY